MTTRLTIEVVVLTAVAGFAVGRWFTTPQVQTRTVVTDHVVLREHVQTVTVHDTTTDTASTDDRSKTKVVTVWKTGPATTVTRVEYVDREKLVTAAQTVDHATTTQTVSLSKVENKQTVQTVTPVATRWAVGAGLGVQPLRLSPVVAVDASYRFAGPFSAVLWAAVPTANPADVAIGVGVRLTF